MLGQVNIEDFLFVSKIMEKGVKHRFRRKWCERIDM